MLFRIHQQAQVVFAGGNECLDATEQCGDADLVVERSLSIFNGIGISNSFKNLKWRL